METMEKHTIYFLFEQDGEVERDFKVALLPILTKYKKPIRAYLARVKYSENDDILNVALCFRTEGGLDEYILTNAVQLFKSMFGNREHLDVIFINQNQEKSLRIVCCPFFTSQDYQVISPDFFLSSSESYKLRNPIACFKRKRLFGKHPDGYLLCDIKPSLVGQHYGMGGNNIKQIILTSRHQGHTIFPITEWPVYVHVSIPLTDLNIKENIEKIDIKSIAWAELYKNKEEAKQSE